MPPRRTTDPEWAVLHSWFPRLVRDSVWVLADANPTYNCLAWALGITDRWVWPWGTRQPLVAEFSQWLALHGYVVGTPAAAIAYGPLFEVGHIGRYYDIYPTSKLGAGLLISHTWGGLEWGIYGDAQQAYRRNIPSDDEVAVSGDDTLGQPAGRPLPPLSGIEMDRLKRMLETVNASDRRAFEEAWAAWRRSLDDPRVSLDSTQTQATRTAEFVRLLVAARAAVPLLVEKLVDPSEPRVVAVAERVLPRSMLVTFSPDDPLVLEGEQYRARLIAANVLSGD